MSTITTRAGKGTALSYAEMDANFTNLNIDKLEASALASYETSAHAAATYATQTTVATNASNAMQKASNLSDVANVATARTNLGVSATGADTTYNVKSANLSDVSNVSTARTNLGLGTAATKDTGTSAGQVIVLDGSAKLPAVDGSQLTGITAGTSSILGAFRNLQASATGLSANVTVTVDEIVVENSSNAYTTLRSVSLTIAGTTTGANALDTGTIATSTWYSVWIIYNGTTVAGLLSTSATSPTLPSGYTHKARIGWIRTDGTANKHPLAFKQYGRRVKYVVTAGSNVTGLPQMSSGLIGNPVTPTWSAVSVSSFVPSSAASISILAYTSGSGAYGIVAPNNSYGGFNGSSVNSATNPPPLIATSSAGSIYGAPNSELALESTNIYAASSGGGGMYIHCSGWEDNL